MKTLFKTAIMAATITLSFQGMANAKVFCSQEIIQKFFVFPLPLIRTTETYGPATGEGETKAMAKYELAQSRVEYMRICNDEIYDIRVWCKEGKIRCVSESEEIFPQNPESAFLN